jgi:dephospho-CoA kinase
MKIIGITGPTGAGKSVLSSLLSELGYPTIDADKVYHDMLIPPSECLDAIRAHFGDGVFAQDGTLERAKLSQIVFNSPEKLELLNKTVLGKVIKRITKMTVEYSRRGVQTVIVDAPTLIESGFNKKCSAVISVLAPTELRVKRIMERDSINEEAARLRVRAQKDDSFYLNNSDRVLYNTENYESFKKEVLSLFSELGIS